MIVSQAQQLPRDQREDPALPSTDYGPSAPIGITPTPSGLFVADDHRLEEESEEPEVPEQSLGIGAQRGRGQRRIDEVADRTLAEDRP